MKHAEFLQKTSFTKEELIGLSHGTAVEDPPSDFFRLPAPPFLMLDRVTEVSREPTKRFIIAEQDIRLDLWFFQCHFIGDPVQPGCLGVDAIWQLLGLYCGCCGAEGVGRALGCKEVYFFGQIRPHNRVVRYEVTVRKYQSFPTLRTGVIIGSAKVFVDDEHVYDITDAKLGTYRDMHYANYPFIGPNALGGAAQKEQPCTRP